MIFPTKIGTDSEGYIVNNISLNKIPEQYIEPLDFIVKNLKSILGSKLHSIYIYGSVGRGNAIVGKSDVDLSIIVGNLVTNNERELLELGKEELLKKYSYIPKVDYDIGVLDEVLLSENLYFWGFWLKHCCSCIYGENLAQRFPKMKPSKNIAINMNRKIESELQNYKRRIETEEDCDKLNLLVKSALKRVIRGTYTLTIESDMSWSDNLSDNVEIFQHYYPREDTIRRVKELLEATSVNKEEVLDAIEYFKCWVTAELDKFKGLPSVETSE